MSAVAAAIGGAAVLGVVGASMSSDAARSAADAQATAASSAADTQLQMFNMQREDQRPYLQAGYGALNDLQLQMPDLTKQFSAADYHQSPGYQFQMQQGMQALQNSAAARGQLNSGATMKAITGYSQGLANQDYQQAQQNFTNSQNQRYNMLAGLSGTGQVANGQLSTAGSNAANGVANAEMAYGNARSAGTMGQANAWNQGLSNAANSGMNMYALSKWGG